VNQKIATPKDAAAVILLNQDSTQVLWAQRNTELKFLGGWHAFPGGKLEASDAEIKVENCAEGELAKFIACAVRETFEEVGVLLARGGEKLTKGQRASLHDDLISGRFSLAEILADWGLRIDAADFFYTGFWTTPQFSPARFKTRFFLAVCPPKQKPYAAITELENVEFIEPEKALNAWANSEVLISPPVLISLQELFATENTQKNGKDLTTDKHGLENELRITNDELRSKNNPKSKIQNPKSISLCGEKLFEKSQKFDGQINYIELNPRIVCFPLKTETLPPATHTNCFVVGKKEFVVIDAAARDIKEQNSFHEFIDSFARSGFVCKAIILTHLHRDHFGGEIVLQKYFLEKFGWRVPISAHRLTAESLEGKIKVDRFIEDKEVFKLQDAEGKNFELKTLHAPGHARGHLCFYDEAFGFLLSGDNVIGTGSVIIAPPEGNMIDYLNSLDAMKNLPNLRFLCGSHGAAISNAKIKIEDYIEHRLGREQKILESIAEGARTSNEIVEKVYADVSLELWKLAEKSVEAHLEKLRTEGKVQF
jgi:glyoxylase-like metal-dependent hydrolase (beta-lactamase superfamily II)/8-oxo-dGTP pyrophosphatase MutT (NUDIX family)